MNKKAMMIVKAEEYLSEAKIPFNTILFDQMTESEMEDFLETWNPENQAALRKKYVSDETNEEN
jgi:arsenate reductase-like glutaredoxin family protein